MSLEMYTDSKKYGFNNQGLRASHRFLMPTQAILFSLVAGSGGCSNLSVRTSGFSEERSGRVLPSLQTPIVVKVVTTYDRVGVVDLSHRRGRGR